MDAIEASTTRMKRHLVKYIINRFGNVDFDYRVEMSGTATANTVFVFVRGKTYTFRIHW